VSAAASRDLLRDRHTTSHRLAAHLPHGVYQFTLKMTLWHLQEFCCRCEHVRGGDVQEIRARVIFDRRTSYCSAAVVPYAMMENS